MYDPESDFLSTEIVSVPFWTFIRPSSQAPPTRLHEIEAFSVAKQFNDKFSPVNLRTLPGGFVMNFGGDQTTTVVTADISPRRFLAVHS